MADRDSSAITSGCGIMRILVVDDEPEPAELIRAVVASKPYSREIRVYHAESLTEARQQYIETFVDHVFLDVYLTKDPLGQQFLQELRRLGASCDVTLMSKLSLTPEADALVRSSTRIKRPRVVNVLRKSGGEFSNVLPLLIDGMYAEFNATSIELTNLENALQILLHRRKRYPSSSGRDGVHFLRSDPAEVAVEIERLCRTLFGRVEGIKRQTYVHVDLQPLERRGLSAAVLLRPRVTVGLKGVLPQTPGLFDCVMKLGPAKDILEEVSRYQEYVRFGVKLDHRVELLSWGIADAMGGICYSFAGGVYGEDLATLDELLRQHADLGRQVIDSLFGSVNWYKISAPSGTVGGYMDRTYKLTLRESVEENKSRLKNLARQWPAIAYDPDSAAGTVSLRIDDGPTLVLPGVNQLGDGWALQLLPRCLVHGDMHGGNVMAEMKTVYGVVGGKPTEALGLARVCLIDYRNAGPGPRCVDASAIDASLRVADAEDVAQEVGGVGATELKGEDKLRALRQCSRRLDTERQVLSSIWGSRGAEPKRGWASLSVAVAQGLRGSFLDESGDSTVTPEEYLQTGILYAVHELAYPLDDVTRIRVCAWLAAQYSFLIDLLKRTANSKSGSGR